MEYLIFSDNQKMIFNYDFFKDKYENGNLKNAEIFAEIFKLKKTVFMKNEMIKNEKNYISICKFLNIFSIDWNIFVNFLNNLIINDDYSILKLHEISNKFGGIPEIDKLQLKNEIKYYNPQNPKEDYKQLYNWTFDMSYKSKEYLKHTQISAGDNYTYYRVLK